MESDFTVKNRNVFIIIIFNKVLKKLCVVMIIIKKPTSK